MQLKLTKVGIQRSVKCEEYVSRLYVAMSDTLSMHERQAIGETAEALKKSILKVAVRCTVGKISRVWVFEPLERSLEITFRCRMEENAQDIALSIVSNDRYNMGMILNLPYGFQFA